MRVLLGAFLLVMSAVIAGGLNGQKAAQAYVTTPVSWGSVNTFVKATGVVNPVLMVEVGSQLSGQIAEVLVDFNERVNAGQVIARVNPETYVAAVSQAKAVLKIAKATAELQKAALEKAKVAAENARTARKGGEADVAAAQAKQEEAERDVQRNLSLSRNSAISNRELTQSLTVRNSGAAVVASLNAQLKMKEEAIAIADAELLMAQANLASALAVVEQHEAALQQAEVDLQRTQIRSPIDGVVIKRIVNSGQTVAVSLESKTLFKVANDLSEMQVEGRIDEADIGQIKEGQSATFTVDAYPDKVFSGRVVQVRKSPELSQSVVTYTAVVSAPNPDQLLFPGMTARLSIVVEETTGSLKVPNSALGFRPRGQIPVPGRKPGSAILWVERNPGEPLPVAVTLGKSDDSGTQVLSGDLREGDPLIIGGTENRETSVLARPR